MISSGLCTRSASLGSRTPNTRNSPFADSFIDQINGQPARVNMTSGGTTQRDSASGWKIASALGATSPNTTCR